ncbi:MAG: DNA gyrase subunit A [Gammaproteobacteria bacterium]|nr:DNA gyrase subunit A [Gammaproteobacteria bacterium]MXW44519.1 DNA gyrase subunit A [Gammaproteobacteria bacterium]MYD01360.1 DNA gyrase subunit A [Gammaproteobacteria bacterium]MYI24680.1 DNA gyrase subunit A [Gammaproteobacteria bacterium]
MAGPAPEIVPVKLEEEMRRSYLDYAMSVIVGRALPDVRDGLKPVHRRILHAMRELGNLHDRPYKKSARIVGDVIGRYHPHGDTAVYDAIVRMAQDFSLRYPLVDGQGNFGSMDGDAPAAMRYTEIRMAPIAALMLTDIDRDTVDFVANYDGAEQEPTVLPARLPNLLVNGASGIAVGMATNIPPHNLREVIDAALALSREPGIGIAELMEHVPGPDFPTAAQIVGEAGMAEAYRTGRGTIQLRARAEIEEGKTRDSIVVTELPYRVNKARCVEKIAMLARKKEIAGIQEVRDESDKDGTRVVVELRRDVSAEIVLNNLYRRTPLESSFGINMVALCGGRPQLLNLKQMLEHFLDHRRDVVTRRSVHDLRRAKARAHVLEGLTVALANIDEVVALIRASSNAQEAREALTARIWAPGAVRGLLERAQAALTELPNLSDRGYRLSNRQARAILELRLQRLTGLEQEAILDEYAELLRKMEELTDILRDPDRLLEVVRNELIDLRGEYGDERRTEIIADYTRTADEDLIPRREVLVTLSWRGYVKTQELETFRTQGRGGRGKRGASVGQEDFIDQLFVTHSHSTLLCFTDRARVFQLRPFEIPTQSRATRGLPIANLLPGLEEGEQINSVLPVDSFDHGRFVFMATRKGRVKKTRLDAFAKIRRTGIYALSLKKKDRLVEAAITDGDSDVILLASNGRAARFSESNVRPMGRIAAGVIGQRLKKKHRVVAALIVNGEDDAWVLQATTKGFGKRTPVSEFPRKGRAAQGVISIRTEGRNGKLIGAALVREGDEAMLMTAGGTLLRTAVGDVSIQGRYSHGVRLMRPDEGDHVAGFCTLAGEEEESASRQ